MDKLNPKAFYASETGGWSLVDQVTHDPGTRIETIIAGDKVIAVIGLSLIWQGVAQFWAVTSPDCEKYPIGFCKCINEAILFYVEHLKLHRVQFMSQPYKGFDRWARFLKFELECFLKKYGPDQVDYAQFVRFF